MFFYFDRVCESYLFLSHDNTDDIYHLFIFDTFAANDA